MLAKAAVHYEAGQGLEIEQLEVLEPRKGEVLVRYVASGVCHSDLHHIQGKVPHPTPVVFGHEGAGIVEAVGADVTSVKVGDHVLTSYIPSCGRCSWCITGRPNLCDLRDLPRHLMHDGTSRFRKGNQEIYQYLQVSTYADRAVVPEVSLIPIRKDAPLDVICLVSCGVMTGAGSVMNRAKVTPGSSVAVFGCGGIGLNAIQMAKIMGASKIIAVDVFDQKLEWSREFGSTHLVNASREDPVERIHEICGKGGADYAIEAVGLQKTMEQAVVAVHRGGTAVMIGVAPTGTRISIETPMLLQERIVTGTSFGSSRQRVDLPMIVDMFMDGTYKLRELISQQIDLEDLNRAYEELERGEVRRSVIVYN
ncbi:MAG: Zn-dependent alcohol dehydrogenase [Chloroflexi bacterium]|nr:Zn-dependent alcohol dehydrogenase [Chloroflexota bacterium]